MQYLSAESRGAQIREMINQSVCLVAKTMLRHDWCIDRFTDPRIQPKEVIHTHTKYQMMTTTTPTIHQALSKYGKRNQLFKSTLYLLWYIYTDINIICKSLWLLYVIFSLDCGAIFVVCFKFFSGDYFRFFMNDATIRLFKFTAEIGPLTRDQISLWESYLACACAFFRIVMREEKKIVRVRFFQQHKKQKQQ